MLELDKIYNMDCLEGMKQLDDNSIDCIVTDPPFAFTGGISNGFASKADSQFFEHWLKEVFQNMHRVSKPESCWFIWCDWRTAGIYDMTIRQSAVDYYDQRWVSQVIIHDRSMIGMGSPFRNQCDWIAVIRGKKTKFRNRIPKNQPNIIQLYWYYGKHDNHPSEKSIEMAKQLIEWGSDVNKLVLDPFVGSGTTAIACRLSNRYFIGMDIEKKYCEIANERLHQKILE